ncbi:MAG: type II toxin-antitoxin system VapC family toxin [Planctomycetota bacterium]
MKVLLDTCTFLWIGIGLPELSRAAREAFENVENEVYLSSVSAWEIAIKTALGRLRLPEAPQRYVPRLRAQHGIETLPLAEEAVLHVSRLPDLHRDPFDRMLVCQAIVHGFVILTPDDAITQYPAPTLW